MKIETAQEKIITPNYYICSGTSRTFAPKVYNIGIYRFKTQFTIPKPIKVKTLYYIDYIEDNKTVTMGDEILGDKRFPMWAIDERDPDNPNYILRKILVPCDKIEEVVAVISNIPAKIKVFYGDEKKEKYQIYVKSLMGRIYEK